MVVQLKKFTFGVDWVPKKLGVYSGAFLLLFLIDGNLEKVASEYMMWSGYTLVFILGPAGPFLTSSFYKADQCVS